MVKQDVVAAVSHAVGWGVLCKDGARGVRARREGRTDNARVPCEGSRGGADGVCEVTRATRMVWTLHCDFYEWQ